jgi:iron complex transport system substrate-binding protein
LLAGRPEVLLVQPGLAGVDPELTRLAEERGWTLGAWRLDRLADVDAMLAALAGLPPVAGNAAALARLETRRGEIAAILAAEPAEDAPRTLLLVSADPPSAAAGGTYLDELLRAAGGRNALADRTGYVGLSLEDIATIAPDATIVLRDEPAGSPLVPPESLVAASRGRLATVACREAFVPASVAPEAVAALRAGLRSIAGEAR